MTANICGPYEPRGPEKRDNTGWRGIVLLRRSDGTDRNSPRDFKSYDGRGASKALIVALDRCAAQAQARADRGEPADNGRMYRMHEMALEQIEREQQQEGSST